jgi:lysophospholipase L1-like esterase
MKFINTVIETNKVYKPNRDVYFRKTSLFTLLSLATLLLLPCNLFSQSIYKEIPEYPFLRNEINKISFPGDTNAFSQLFEKMDKLIFQGKGQVNIMHFGGSHIQADLFSNTFRNNLLTFHPGIIASRGLVFPFSAAKTNNPYNYISTFKGNWTPVRNIHREIVKPLGMSGIAIYTSDTAAEITIKIRNSAFETFHEFNRIRIIGHSENMSFEPILKLDSIFFLNGKYDSTSSSYLFNLQTYADSLTILFQSNDTLYNPFTLSGIILENDFPGLTYHSVGVNGASVPSYLKCENLERDLLLIKPDLVIFSIGINDASGDNFDPEVFKSNYTELIRRIKQSSPDCAILFTTNNDSYRRVRRKYYVNNNGPIAQTAFFELARQHNAGVWDFFSIMGGLKSMSEWEKAGLANRDKIHFVSPGYRLMGDLIYNAFINEYLKHLSLQE